MNHQSSTLVSVDPSSPIHSASSLSESSFDLELPDFDLDNADLQDLDLYFDKEEETKLSKPIDSTDEIPTTEAVDALLAREMAKLSMEQIEDIYHELHGIKAPPKETPEIISKGLADFNNLLLAQEQQAASDLQSPLASSMTAYLLAKTKDREYVEADTFRLLFLRQTRWNIPAAAESLYKHFARKLELFQEDLLTRDIMWDDLSTREQQIAYSGYFRMLSQRDRAGRSIIVLSALSLMNAEENLPPIDPSKAIDCRGRVVWYLAMKYLQCDEDLQRNGMVVISYAIGDTMSHYANLKHMRRMRYVREGIPYRMAGAHFCHNNFLLKNLVDFVRLINGTQTRVRFRIHYSTNLDEIKLLLLGYGIPTHALPALSVDEKTGKQVLSNDDHKKIVDQIREQERAAEAFVTVPRRFDVLFGRGKEAKLHTGNFRCFHIVNMYHLKYERASKYEKTEIAEQVVRIIHESGGRFLKPSKYGWEEASDEVARAKIGHFFRRLRSDSNQECETKADKRKSGGAETEGDDGKKRVRE
jgi:hypothetical protein